MDYLPQHIANYFLERASNECVPVTPLKLVKLVYIAYGWNIAITGDKLFDEPIEAWRHGPVVPSLYHEFKHFNKEPITCLATNLDMDTFEITTPRIMMNDDATNLVLSKVWVAYKRFDAWALRNKTHEKGSPWDKVYKKGGRGIELKDADIVEHYAERIREYIDASKTAAA